MKFSQQSTDIQVIHESCPHQMPFLTARGALHRADGLPFEAGGGIRQRGNKRGQLPAHPARRGADGARFGCCSQVSEITHPVRRSIHTYDGPHELEVRRGEYQCVSSWHGVRSYVVPHLFMLLPKRWNSNCKERTNMPAYGNIKISLTETLKKYPLESPNIFGSIIFTPSMAVFVTSIVYSATLLRFFHKPYHRHKD